MHSTITAFFAWPNGGVWSNLLASALTVIPGFVVHHQRIRKKHDAAIAQQTQQIKDHIDSTIGGPRP